MKDFFSKLKNKKVVGLLVSILVVIIILMNSTYSLLVRTDETDVQSYTTGILEITSEATNNSVTLTNSLPMEDSAGLALTPYTFTITNTGNLNFTFDVKLLSTTTENQIDAQYIKLKVDDGEVVTLGSLTDGKILENITLFPGKSIEISLCAWLDINTPNTQIGKVFNAKIVTEGYAEYTIDSSAVLTNLGLSVTEGTPDFTKTSCSSGCDEATVGLYESEDDLGISYYFRGDVTNNYVYFAGFYWRIIRINGDGTVRMIYDGPIAYTNGTPSANRAIGQSKYNEKSTDNAFVGYMNGTSDGESFPIGAYSVSVSYDIAHNNLSDSTIKTYIDNWYKTNIEDKGYSEYIVDAIYCNDRSLSSGTGWGTTTTYYSGYQRLKTNKIPTLNCLQVNDRFTKSESLGNGDLTYPVGMITADEIIMAGASTDSSSTNTNFYLYTGYDNWQMTPSGYYATGTHGFVFYSNGYIQESTGSTFVTNSKYVRPVITINADTIKSGDGTTSNPFSTVELDTESAITTLTSLDLVDSIQEDTPDFTKTSCSSGCDESTVGIYSSIDDLGISYYFRGDVTNNYVKFAKDANGSDMYWRIVRINGDGTVRMIYMGTDINATRLTPLGTSMFNENVNDNTYGGYMYGTAGASTYADTHSNATNSKIKIFLEGDGTTTNEGWYKDNIIDTGYSNYVADSIYCNDRSLSSGTGIATTNTSYGLGTSLKCINENDRFTQNNNLGNGLLEYPVGLITVNEVKMAGGRSGGGSNYYLAANDSYWTMSPSGYYSYRGGFIMYFVNNSAGTYGWINDTLTNSEYGVLPVISLKSTAIIDGSGIITDPFVVE